MSNAETTGDLRHVGLLPWVAWNSVLTGLNDCQRVGCHRMAMLRGRWLLFLVAWDTWATSCHSHGEPDLRYHRTPIKQLFFMCVALCFPVPLPLSSSFLTFSFYLGTCSLIIAFDSKSAS